MVHKIMKHIRLLVFFYTTLVLGSDENLIKNIDIDNFETEILQAELPVFFKISVPWCAACKTMEIIYPEVVDEFKGSAIFANADIDLRQNTELLQKMFQDYKILISSFPVVLVFNQGKYVRCLSLRSDSQKDLSEKFNSILKDIEKGSVV